MCLTTEGTDMHTVGVIAPETPEEVRDIYQELSTPSEVVVKEVARAISLDPEEYDQRVSEEVIKTARDAMFASLLTVSVGTKSEYEDWKAGFDGDVREIGNENVDNVVWHVFGRQAIAATYQAQQNAAVATLQRQAFGEIYSKVVRS